jgi:hypothetical protein
MIGAKTIPSLVISFFVTSWLAQNFGVPITSPEQVTNLFYGVLILAVPIRVAVGLIFRDRAAQSVEPGPGQVGYNNHHQSAYSGGHYPAPPCIATRDGHLTGANAERAWAEMTQEEQKAYTNSLYGGIGGVHYHVKDMRPPEEIPYTPQWAAKYRPGTDQLADKEYGYLYHPVDDGRRPPPPAVVQVQIGRPAPKVEDKPKVPGMWQGSEEQAAWAERAINQAQNMRASGMKVQGWDYSQQEEEEQPDRIEIRLRRR